MHQYVCVRECACVFVCVRVSVCVCICECKPPCLTMGGDCLNGLALAFDVPYGESSVRVTTDELLALVVPGD